jgi:Ner family transcriptional regulator
MSNRKHTLDIPTDPEARRAWVVYQLHLKHTSLAAIARSHGLSAHACGKALRVPSARMEQALAEALDLKPEVLFPERYREDGVRKIRTSGSRTNIKRRAQPRIVKESAAA